MTAWLCRVMAAVFTFNVLAPVDLLAQNAPAKRAPAVPRVDIRKVEQAAQDQYEQYKANIQEEYANAEDVFSLYAALKKLHDPEVKKPRSPFDLAAMQERLKAPPKFMPDTSFINPDYMAYMAAKEFAETRREKQDADELINRIVSAKEPWENLMLYLDPVFEQSDSWMSTIVVAEILGNTVDMDRVEEMDLLELQLRAIFRLLALEEDKSSSYTEKSALKKAQDSRLKIQAIGTLRMLLYKVQQYYQRTGQENPLFKRAKRSVRTPAKISRVSNYQEIPIVMGIPPLPGSAEFQLFSPAMYGHMMSQFLATLRDLKAKDLKSGSAEYEDLALWADFAVAYAMMYDPDVLVQIVKMFDGGPKATDFEQTYTTVLGTAFQSMRENLQFSPIKGPGQEVLALLPQFSDPQKYSVPTRIFALEAASVLYQQQDGSNNILSDFQQENGLFQAWYNSFTPDSQTRVLLAARAVDLYDSLTRYYYETYGLDSKQMQMLSDKLAKIYNGFANANLKTSKPEGEKTSPYNAAYTSTGKLQVANGATEVPRLVFSKSSPYMFEDSSGRLKNIHGLGRKSDGKWIEMTLWNPENQYKVKNDMNAKIVTFIAEVVLWIWGGEILSLVGRAFRVARGATMALPRAVQAASSANKGRRMLAFSVEVKKGVRMSTLTQDLARNGVSIGYGRMPKISGPQATTTVVQKTGSTAAPRPVFSAANSTAKLQNRYAWYNPKRWLGINRQPITEIEFTQFNPGFRVTRGRMSVAPGSTLSLNGIRTYDDWRRVRMSLKHTHINTYKYTNITTHEHSNITKITYERIHFYNFWKRKELQQEMRLMKWATSSAKAGAFDVWLPTRNGYWNFTRYGKPAVLPEEALGIHEFVGNRILIAPRGQLPGRSLITRAESSLLTDAVSVTGTDVLSGRWASSVARHYFTAMSWRKPVARLLMPKYVPSDALLHNIAANPLQFGLIAGSRALMSTRFVPGIMGNTVFFGSWMGLDYAVNPSMQRYIAKTSEEEVRYAQQSFGDAYDPELLKEDDASSTEILESLREQGFTPPSSSVLNDVRGAQNPSSEGALFAFPFLAATHGLSKTWLGRTMGVKTPFMTDGVSAQLEIAADRIQIKRLVRKYNKAKDKKDVEAYCNELLAGLDAKIQTYEDLFIQLARVPGAGDLAAERKEMTAYLHSLKRTVEDTSKSSEPAGKKVERLNKVCEEFVAKETALNERILLKTHAPQGEAAFFKKEISYWEKYWDSYKNGLYYSKIDEKNPKVLAKADKIFKNLIGQLRKLQKKRMSFSAKYEEVLSITSAAEDKIQALSESIKRAAPAASTLTREDLRTAEASFIDMAEAEAKQAGLALDAFFREWRSTAAKYCADDTYTVEDLKDALNLLNVNKLEELDKLFIKANETKTVQPSAETGTLSPEGLDELLPDETSAVFTGA